MNIKRKNSGSPTTSPTTIKPDTKKAKTHGGEQSIGLSVTPAKRRPQMPLNASHASQRPIENRSLKKVESPQLTGVTPYYCLMMGEFHLSEGRVKMAKAYFKEGQKIANFNENKGLIDPRSKNTSDIARLLREGLETTESMPEDTEPFSEEKLKDDVALKKNQNLSEADFLAESSSANAKQALEFKKLADKAAAENDFPREILYLFEGLDCLKNEPASNEAKKMFLNYINSKFQSVDEVKDMMLFWKDSDIKLTISKEEIDRVLDIISRIPFSEENLKDDVALKKNQNLSEADFLAESSSANAKQALEFKKLADKAAAENDFPREILYLFEGLDCLKDEPSSDKSRTMFLDYINNKFQSVDEVKDMMLFWKNSDIKLTISKEEIDRVLDIISGIK